MKYVIGLKTQTITLDATRIEADGLGVILRIFQDDEEIAAFRSTEWNYYYKNETITLEKETN